MREFLVLLMFMISPLALGQASNSVPLYQHELRPQQPGMELDGDVAGVKDSTGMVILWNRSQPYFSMHVPGNQFKGMGQHGTYFKVDGMFLQVQSTGINEFWPDAKVIDPAAILVAHRDWEAAFLQRAAGVAMKLNSRPGKLNDGTPVLFWEMAPTKVRAGMPTSQLFVTRFEAGKVILAGSALEDGVSKSKAKAVILDAISHVNFSPTPFDFKAVQKDIANGP